MTELNKLNLDIEVPTTIEDKSKMNILCETLRKYEDNIKLFLEAGEELKIYDLLDKLQKLCDLQEKYDVEELFNLEKKAILGDLVSTTTIFYKEIVSYGQKKADFKFSLKVTILSESKCLLRTIKNMKKQCELLANPNFRLLGINLPENK